MELLVLGTMCIFLKMGLKVVGLCQMVNWLMPNDRMAYAKSSSGLNGQNKGRLTFHTVQVWKCKEN